MALLDVFGYLGTDFQTLFIFLISGGIISIILGAIFYRLYGVDSLSFKLVLRVILLVLPLSWLGLSVGSNLSKIGEIREGVTFTVNDAIINILVTLIISIIIAIPIIMQ